MQTSSTNTNTDTYTKATDITQLSTESNVYYLQEVENGRFEVYFGDGVVSKALSDNNIVILRYVVTNKTASNGASSFSAPSTIDGVSDITVTTGSNAGGGAEPESLESIKLQAHLDFASQGRAVTKDDYEVYTRKLFPNTQSDSEIFLFFLISQEDQQIFAYQIYLLSSELYLKHQPCLLQLLQ